VLTAYEEVCWLAAQTELAGPWNSGRSEGQAVALLREARFNSWSQDLYVQ